MPKVYYVPSGFVVDPGSALSFASNVLSVDVADYGEPGVVSVRDGGALVVADGELSVREATVLKPGVVRPDGVTITVSNGIIRAAHQTLETATEQEAVEGTNGSKAMTPKTTAAAIGAAVPAAVAADAESRPRWEVRVDAEGKRRLAIVVPGN